MTWTTELTNKYLKAWREKIPLTYTTNFAGSIQLNDDLNEVKTKLARCNSLSLSNSKPQKQDLENPSSVLPAEVESQQEDFVDVTYRALSAAMLADRPVDFSKGAVVKNATKKLVGQTVFKDHNTNVDNWVGRVASTNWDTETKGIPPGINAVLRLDMVKDPMTVRGVLQGALHSASVTVTFQWEPSHKELMDNGTFFSRLGEEIDGQTVRIVVTKIEKFWEISLVWQGADEFAKQIDEKGKPVLSADPSHFSQANHHHGSWEGGMLSSAAINAGPFNKEEDMSLSDRILELLGKDTTIENLQDKVEGILHSQAEKELALNGKVEDVSKALVISTDQVESLRSKVGELTSELEVFKKEVEGLKTDAETGRKYLEDLRAEAVKIYTTLKGKDAKSVILDTINKGDLTLVKAWLEDLKLEREQKIPNRCGKCGSKEVSRQSSVTKSTGEDSENKTVLNEDSYKNVRQLHA